MGGAKWISSIHSMTTTPPPPLEGLADQPAGLRGRRFRRFTNSSRLAMQFKAADLLLPVHFTWGTWCFTFRVCSAIFVFIFRACFLRALWGGWVGGGGGAIWLYLRCFSWAVDVYHSPSGLASCVPQGNLDKKERQVVFDIFKAFPLKKKPLLQGCSQRRGKTGSHAPKSPSITCTASPPVCPKKSDWIWSPSFSGQSALTPATSAQIAIGRSLFRGTRFLDGSKGNQKRNPQKTKRTTNQFGGGVSPPKKDTPTFLPGPNHMWDVSPILQWSAFGSKKAPRFSKQIIAWTMAHKELGPVH